MNFQHKLGPMHTELYTSLVTEPDHNLSSSRNLSSIHSTVIMHL